MIKSSGFLALFLLSGPASATDFGIRLAVPLARPPMTPPRTDQAPADVRGASLLGAQFGRITSIGRSIAHNRAVGGVANSYHLRGRAIDIARRAGVTHHQIEAALRHAGYHLLESFDEGDHSHFAFGPAGRLPVTIAQIRELTRWGIVYAPGGR